MHSNSKIELPREELELLYLQQNLSSAEIARRFGCHPLTVRARLREHGIELKPRGWHKRIECVPATLLHSWPNRGLAYVTGLIASDGNLQKRNNCVILMSTDRALIEQAVELLQLANPHIISVNQGPPRKPSFILQVCDYRLRSFLEGLGLAPCKTLTIGLLKIPDSVMPDFVRGEFDGDGGWYVGRGWRNCRYLIGKLTSKSPAYLEWLQESIVRLAGVRGLLSPARLVYNGKNAERLGEWLYRDSEGMRLERKLQIWRGMQAKPEAR